MWLNSQAVRHNHAEQPTSIVVFRTDCAKKVHLSGK
jgi:hypothetical protein